MVRKDYECKDKEIKKHKKVKEVNSCFEYCKEESKCKSYMYDHKKDECELFADQNCKYGKDKKDHDFYSMLQSVSSGSVKQIQSFNRRYG